MLARVYFNKLKFPKDFATMVKPGRLKDRVREVYGTQQNLRYLFPVAMNSSRTQVSALQA